MIYVPVGYDQQFYDACCTGDAPECNLFYQRRAIGTCEGYSPPACCGKCAPVYNNLTYQKSLHANDTPLL